MKLDLAGKVAIITGGASGIGKGITLALANAGANAVICDMAYERAIKLEREIKASGHEAFAIKADVTKSDEVNGMVRKTVESYGKLDILVNNAGIIRMAPIAQFDEKDWDLVFNVNIKGVFLCCKAAAPYMIKQKSGKIINVSSVSGKSGGAAHAGFGFTAYIASKFAAIGFTQNLAKELAQHNINVNAVCPGFLQTDMQDAITASLAQRAGLTPEEFTARKVAELVPLGRPQTPEDVGNLVVFLVSENAKNITGASVHVDGGMEMR